MKTAHRITGIGFAEGEARVRSLGRSELFSCLPPRDLRRAADASSLQEHRKGTRLWNAGDPCDGVVVVVSGRVQCWVEREGAKQWVSQVLGPGEVGGLTALVDGGTHTSIAEVTERSTLVHVPQTTVAHLLARDHPFALRAAQLLAGNLRRSISACEQMALLTPLQRLAYLIVSLSDDGGHCRLPGTQSQIAARIGTVREVVGRGLRQLEADGVLERQGRSVRVLQPAVLENLLD